MGILTHSLERLALLLHGVVVAAETIDLQLGGLNLTGLTSTLTLYQQALYIDAGTCGDVLQQLLIKLGGVNDNLHILDGRTIVQRDEVDSLRTTVRAHPALHTNFFSKFGTLQYVNYLCSFHFSFCFVCRHTIATYCLLVSAHAKAVDLFLSEVAPVTTANILFGETSKLHAVKFYDLVAQALKDAAYDAVLT